MIILMIGLGSVGKKHLLAIGKLVSDAKIYALRSSLQADEYPGVKNIFSLNELKEKPAFVIISNPTSMHKTSLKDVLQLDCPVFIEKPVFHELMNTDQLLDEIQNRKTLTYVACNLRFHPAIQFLKSFLDTTKPAINEVNIYCGSYLPEWRPGIDFRTSYSARKDMGGGVHLDLIHELDYCTWLFGMPLNVDSNKTNLSSLNIEVPDNAQFRFGYSSFNANINLNYYRRDAKREIEIVTDNDTIIADLLTNKVVSKPSGTVLYEKPFTMADTYYDQMSYFISHINQHLQPMNSIGEGVEVLKLALYE